MVISPVLRTLNAAGFDAATQFLPTITGFPPSSFRPGHPVESVQMRAALKWIRAFQRSDMAGQVNIRTIDISSGTALAAVTEQGNEVSFAYDKFETQLARWRKVHEFGLQRRMILSSLDLAVTNYVPAVWVPVSNSIPATVRPTPKSPYRKKHV